MSGGSGSGAGGGAGAGELGAVLAELRRRREGAELSPARLAELGLFDPAIAALGVSGLSAILCELSRAGCAEALGVFAHWAARGLFEEAGNGAGAASGRASSGAGAEAAPGGWHPVLACAPFESLEEIREPVTAAAVATAASGAGATTGAGGAAGADVVLSGRVESAVLLDAAARLLVAARESGTEGNGRGLANPGPWSLFSIERAELQGRTTPVATIGARGRLINDVVVSGARARRVGSVGGAERVFAARDAGLAPAAGAIALGLAIGALDEAREYSKTRRQGGRELAGWSAVRMLLGRMSARVETGRAALEAACRAADARESGWQRRAESSAVFLQELACDVTNDGIQVLGGAGYTTEFAQERRYRDAFQVQHLLGHLSLRRLRLAGVG